MGRSPARRSPSPVLLGLGLGGVGCSARVQHGLDERQANEIQTVLVERGFRARKVMEEGRPPTWAVEVESADAADAVRVLAELGLPRARPAGVRELLKPGLVPDPVEQHALLVEAQSGELARTLEAVDGVVSARVHLVRPQPDEDRRARCAHEGGGLPQGAAGGGGASARDGRQVSGRWWPARSRGSSPAR